MGKNKQKHTADILEEADISKLMDIMKELEASGQTEIASALSSEITEARKKQAVATIKQAAVVADGGVKGWLIPAITNAYVTGINALQEELAKFAFKTALGKITVETIKTVPVMKPHLDAMNALLSDAYLDFGSGITGFVKGAEHVMNDAIKKQIQSKIGIGRLAGDDMRTIKKEIKEQLSQRGFEVLLDRGGHQWTLDRYSEMLARTHIISANTEATVNRAAQLEVDIVEVSTHGADDDLCNPQEGKIYSISGNSKNYPKLTEVNTPPFHPNCRHTLLPRPDLS